MISSGMIQTVLALSISVAFRGVARKQQIGDMTHDSINYVDGLSTIHVHALTQHPQIDLLATSEEGNSICMHRSTAKLVATLAALFLSLFVVALDYTIVSMAIPTISDHCLSSCGYT